MKFKVQVEKRMYALGTVEVDCDNAGDAIDMVQNQINNGILQTTHVKWDKAQYEDCSFETTREVDLEDEQ